MLQRLRSTALCTHNALQYICSIYLNDVSCLNGDASALPHQRQSPWGWRTALPSVKRGIVSNNAAPNGIWGRGLYSGRCMFSQRAGRNCYSAPRSIETQLSSAYSTASNHNESTSKRPPYELSREQIFDMLSRMILSPEEFAELQQKRDLGHVLLFALHLIVNRLVDAYNEHLEGEEVFAPGDILGMGRYKLLKVALPMEDVRNRYLARKSWLVCWDAVDLKTNKEVVIQLTESADPEVYEAGTRAAAMRALAGHHRNILALLDVFEHRTQQGRHACLVFEKAGSPLTTVELDYNGRKEWSRTLGQEVQMEWKLDWSGCMLSDIDGIRALKSIAVQLFTVLRHMHNRGLVHGDISANNILLDRPFVHDAWRGIRSRGSSSSEKLPGFLGLLQMFVHAGRDKQARDAYEERSLHKATIKLTGFAGAIPCKLRAAAKGGPLEHVPLPDRYGHVVGTPVESRPPEEVLGLDHVAPPADIWKAGLLLYKLAMGNTLFSRVQWWRTRAKYEKLAPYTDDDFHLMEIVDTLGNLPRALIRRSPHFNQFFMYDDTLKIGRVIDIKPAAFDVSKLVQHLWKYAVDKQEADAFHDFISSVLVLDPSNRPTAAEVLKHPWLQDKAHAEE